MMICHCKTVTHRCVDRAVREGARTWRRSAATRAPARTCGMCVFSVKSEVQASALALGVADSA